jgi:arabinan endo-1,5-alpha-L-arabinosidase
MKLKPLVLYSCVPLIALGLLSAHGRIEGSGTPDCGCSAGAQAVAQEDKGAVLPIQGKTFRVHDPSIAKEGDTYYVFSTGRGITVQTSKDMVTWQLQGRAFAQPIPWTSTTIPGSTDYYWAPDISFFNGKWHLYYSVSTFGKNRSAIGLATNVTLNPARPDYQWKDEGSVFESNLTDDWNAIDPNLAIDEKGQAWLTFGSFWSGIQMIKLDSKLGIPTDKVAQIYHLASRPRGGEIKGSIEAPFIFRHGGYFYLFASFDFCCRGVRSTYNVRVGRARKITGPYVDREGKPMLEGGGTMVVSGSGRWHGTGHNAVYHEGKTDWLVYHAYDGEDFGASKLRIEKMTWDAAGWPEVPSMAPAASKAF